MSDSLATGGGLVKGAIGGLVLDAALQDCAKKLQLMFVVHSGGHYAVV